MGRVQLVNSVISSMLVFSFHIYTWPSRLLKQLTIMIKNFVWSGVISQIKICTVAWKSICKNRFDGGLDIRDPHMVNKASMMVLCWQLLTSQEQWACMCRARFFRTGKPVAYNITSSIWPGWKSHIGSVLQNSTWRIGNGESVDF